MPLYDYTCTACGSEREVQHSMSEIGKIEVTCTVCGAKMKKMLSAPTLIGFDDVGRSIGKKEKAEGGKSEGTGKPAKESKSTKKDAA